MTDLKLTTAQRRLLTECGTERVKRRRRGLVTGVGETYLTSDRRIGGALERRGLVTSEQKRDERYWTSPFTRGWQSTIDRWTEYRLTELGRALADQLGEEALAEREEARARNKGINLPRGGAR